MIPGSDRDSGLCEYLKHWNEGLGPPNLDQHLFKGPHSDEIQASLPSIGSINPASKKKKRPRDQFARPSRY
jgi:hypothetical protein